MLSPPRELSHLTRTVSICNIFGQMFEEKKGRKRGNSFGKLSNTSAIPFVTGMNHQRADRGGRRRLRRLKRRSSHTYTRSLARTHTILYILERPELTFQHSLLFPFLVPSLSLSPWIHLSLLLPLHAVKGSDEDEIISLGGQR